MRQVWWFDHKSYAFKSVPSYGKDGQLAFIVNMYIYVPDRKKDIKIYREITFMCLLVSPCLFEICMFIFRDICFPPNSSPRCFY